MSGKSPMLSRSLEEAALAIWTLYQSPDDYPGLCIVRRWVVPRAGGEPVADPDPIYFGFDLSMARAAIPIEADACIHRSPSDERSIVETWV